MLFVYLGGNYMIPVCRDEISTCTAGQISPYDNMRKLNFVPARLDSFPLGICLDLYAISFNFFSVTMSVYEIKNS